MGSIPVGSAIKSVEKPYDIRLLFDAFYYIIFQSSFQYVFKKYAIYATNLAYRKRLNFNEIKPFCLQMPTYSIICLNLPTVHSRARDALESIISAFLKYHLYNAIIQDGVISSHPIFI